MERTGPGRTPRAAPKRRSERGDDKLQVKVTARGPTPEVVAATSRQVLAHPRVREALKGTRHRLLEFTFIEPDLPVKPVRVPPSPDRFRATIFDYTNSRSLFVEGSLNKPRLLDITQSSSQPWPTDAEFDEALQTIHGDPELGPALKDKLLQPYRPMPPLVRVEHPDGRSDRVLAIGMLPTRKGIRHEIVGVDMIHQKLLRYENGAPPGSVAHNPICGLPGAGQPTATRGTPGSVWVNVIYGGTTVWRFLVVRPAASSGTNGSGVELQYVDYKGKRLLYRAHVPILTVSYDGNVCGPYRDKQWIEGMFQANGTDVAPGFRLCPTPAKTILDSGSDLGNYLGVAIYVDGLEVVLVSEMEAGWYRYISEWRLHVNGTIRPRFGFSGTQNSCVCTRHYHHAYWRFDFDIVTPGNNAVREYNNPCLPFFCPSNWHGKYYEIMRFRDPTRQRKWRVENLVSGEAYDIVPGSTDGPAPASPDFPFPVGDVWVLHYRSTELDDGVVAWGPPYAPGLNSFVNGEWIWGQDVVVWYGAHFTHDVSSEPPGVYGDRVGPDLVPVKW